MMKKALAGLLLIIAVYVAMDRFVMPSYTQQGKSVTVPDVTRRTYDVAAGALESAGLSVKKSFTVRYLKNVDSTMVIDQRPAAGSAVKPGRTVYLVVNKREKPVIAMPDFYGRPLDEARQILRRLEVGVKEVAEQEILDPDEDGKVLGQSIAPNSMVSTDASVSLIVGRIAEEELVERKPVPDVLGMSLSQARSLIVEEGFNTGNVYYEYSSLLVPNTVISQKPAVNTPAEPGQVVDLTVVTDQE